MKQIAVRTEHKPRLFIYKLPGYPGGGGGDLVSIVPICLMCVFKSEGNGSFFAFK